MKQFLTSEQDRAQIEALIAKLNMSVAALSADIDAEEKRTGVYDNSAPFYPTLANHLRARRDNLNVTIAELRSRIPRQIDPDRLTC